jgi:hypothetical protein
MNCKKHPKYKALRKPKADCLECWKMYAKRLETEIYNIVNAIETGGSDWVVKSYGSKGIMPNESVVAPRGRLVGECGKVKSQFVSQIYSEDPSNNLQPIVLKTRTCPFCGINLEHKEHWFFKPHWIHPEVGCLFDEYMVFLKDYTLWNRREGATK